MFPVKKIKKQNGRKSTAQTWEKKKQLNSIGKEPKKGYGISERRGNCFGGERRGSKSLANCKTDQGSGRQRIIKQNGSLSRVWGNEDAKRGGPAGKEKGGVRVHVKGTNPWKQGKKTKFQNQKRQEKACNKGFVHDKTKHDRK